MPLKNNSFPREERLRNDNEFRAVYNGKRLSGRNFVIYYLCRSCEPLRKAGFTVSKKVSKSAVRRNKIKRRLREIYRLNRHILPECAHIVIRALPAAADTGFHELEKEIVGFFSVVASRKFGGSGY